MDQNTISRGDSQSHSDEEKHAAAVSSAAIPPTPPSVMAKGELRASLHRAAEQDDAVKLELLLELKGDPNTVLRGLSLVTWASMRGSCTAVATLLSRRADPNAQDANDGNTALHLAVRAQRKAVVTALLEGKANAEVVNNKGDTALSSALQRNMKGVVEEILARHSESREVALRNAHTINFRNRGYTPLLQAIEEGQHEAAEALIMSAAATEFQARTKKGVTPLMMACQHSVDLAELMLENPIAAATAGLRSSNQHSAQDYARIAGFHQLAQRLSRLEDDQVGARCPVCLVALKKSNKLRYLRETFAAECQADAANANPLLQEFFRGSAARELEAPEFHALNEQVSLRKEITESMAIYTTIRDALDGPDPVHVVDLCCGKSWTTAFIATRHPEAIVTPVDRFPASFLPHYGSNTQVAYRKMDLFDTFFLRDMQERIEQVGRRAIIVGMHLCGHLSTVAVDLFHATPLAQEIILCPCCLPNHKDEASPPHIYASKDSAAQYAAWVAHLGGEVERMAGCETTTHFHAAILSERRGVIHGTKRAGAGHAAPETRLGGKGQREPSWQLEPCVVGPKAIPRLQIEAQGVTVRLTVRNKGGKTGSQSVAACLRYADADAARGASREDGDAAGPRQPVFYSKVRDCGPGDEVTLEFRIKARQFSRLSWELWEKAGTWPGEYDVIVTAGEITATERFTVIPFTHGEDASASEAVVPVMRSARTARPRAPP